MGILRSKITMLLFNIDPTGPLISGTCSTNNEADRAKHIKS